MVEQNFVNIIKSETTDSLKTETVRRNILITIFYNSTLRIIECKVGGLIIDMWNCSAPIKHSILHVGQRIKSDSL